MKTKLEIDNWSRRDHFHFFNAFDEPFFGVTVELDCSLAYDYCKANEYSLFQYYLHKSLVAANEIENFRYRIIEDEVWEFDQVHASAVIYRADGTFGFSYIDFKVDFEEFSDLASSEIERVKNAAGLKPAAGDQNVIHCSAMPWLNFKGLSHARHFQFKDSCPKFSYGQITEVNGRRLMPVSIHVNHALMDGFHVSKFVDRFQILLNGDD